MADLLHPHQQSRRVSGHPRVLLLAGALAGPVYVVVGAVEALVRDGFDPTRHSLSLLANGEDGWVHMAMMVTTGVLCVLGAAGLARAMPRPSRARAAVVGLVVFGLGVAVAGLLRADPAEGFPPGTPDGPPDAVSWHGIGHLVAGGVGFLGLIVACLALARWFRRRGQTGWATFSLVTGVYYFAAFGGIASGAGGAVGNLAFAGAVVLGWAWITLLMWRADRERGLR